MLLDEILNGTKIVRWSKRGREITKQVSHGPDLRPIRNMVPVEQENTDAKD
jgi:hypothetical protein